MDAPRFDHFARGISARLTRRTGLGLLAGVSLPLLGLSGEADAKKKKKITLCVNGKTVKAPKKKAKKLLKQGATKGACAEGCPAGQRTCRGGCIPAADCCVDNDCNGTDVCVDGACVSCPAEQKACGSGCIPITNCCIDDDCDGTDRCQNGSCIPLRCGNGGVCTVFQTAAFFAGGEVGGLAGGDAKCQTAANTAGLEGTYKAWLSFGNSTPELRFTNVDNAGPYHLVPNSSDGGNPPPKVADNFGDLFTCGSGDCLDNAISRDENGVTQFTNQGVWTGTKANGDSSGDTCSGWTSSASGVFGLGGVNSAKTVLWTDFGISSDCSFTSFLFCFQQAT